MKKEDLMREIEEVVSVEDKFVENLASLNVTVSKHANFADEDTIRKLRTGFEGLLNGSRRHLKLMKELRIKLKWEEKDEY
ncbi:MAG: hypothetical protein KAS04_00120 [Candidatus Aenigmarchaeota archaeon]|nr:hypothetical protein [Candidatus Aenigmarchaeota archaeon]